MAEATETGDRVAEAARRAGAAEKARATREGYARLEWVGGRWALQAVAQGWQVEDRGTPVSWHAGADEAARSLARRASRQMPADVAEFLKAIKVFEATLVRATKAALAEDGGTAPDAEG